MMSNWKKQPGYRINTGYNLLLLTLLRSVI
jgi:hypothetical protein